ncbi:RNA polymerase sigma factor [Brumimicrobium mesophilum]|uniref:RNA polymerase sigma factor n=1 Tax=Brumimicrobium mesophilum TaxID=392717 RepID=UPI000D141BBC|nr:sigma-70 family RNA polymerase sigma factor [Brumimicrobium mesophilum]
MEEKQLIKQILKGDSSSFAILVDQYQDMAMTIAYRILRNKQEAEDVVQNAFVKSYHNLHSFRLNSKFSTWFYRIVYNTAITSMNKIKNRREEEISEHSGVHAYDLKTESNLHSELDEQKSRVNKAIQQLSKNESVVVTLYYLEEYSVTDVAEIMSLSKSNVKINLFRARKKLEDILK